MPEPHQKRFSADVETAIAGHRRQVRRALEQAGRSPNESEGIVADVEQHLRSQLPASATLGDVQAVLARMDPPAAYAGDDAPVGPSTSAARQAPRGTIAGYGVALFCVVAIFGGLYYMVADARLAKRHAAPVVAPARESARIPATATATPPPVAPAVETTAAAPVADERLAIAVLSFQGSDNLANRATVSTELVDGIINALAMDPGFRIVEREQLQAAFQELRLSADGAVQPDTAASVGRLIGARVIVLGNLTRVGDTLTVTARLLNPETGELAAVRAEGAVGAVTPLAEAVAAKIIERVGADAKGTFARAADGAALAAAEKLSAVRAGLAGKTLPRMLVMIPESHLGAFVRDPAAETELVRWLTECGFAVASPEYEGVNPPQPVRDTTSDTEIAFHRERGLRNEDGDVTIASRVLRECVTGGLASEREKLLTLTDVVILGEGISERGTEREGLVSAKGRVEIKAVDVRTGQVLLAASEYGAGVDVAERIAGKRALQAAGGTLAATLIPDLVRKWEEQQVTP